MNDGNFFNIDISLLLNELELDNISDNEKTEIAEMLKATIIAKIKVYLHENLAADDLEFLDQNSDNPELMQRFLIETKGIDFNQLLIAIAQDSREELMRDVEYIRGVIDAQHGGPTA